MEKSHDKIALVTLGTRGILWKKLLQWYIMD